MTAHDTATLVGLVLTAGVVGLVVHLALGSNTGSGVGPVGPATGWSRSRRRRRVARPKGPGSHGIRAASSASVPGVWPGTGHDDVRQLVREWQARGVRVRGKSRS